MNAWLPTLVFLQTQGPRWKKGFATLFAACMVASVCFSESASLARFVKEGLTTQVLIWVLQKRDERAKRETSDIPQIELGPSTDAVYGAEDPEKK